MSEAEAIFKKFMNELRAEKRASCGNYPAVCVAGRWDYDTLEGAALTMFNASRTIDITRVAGQSFEFMGVKVFKTYSRDFGFYMGSVDE